MYVGEDSDFHCRASQGAFRFNGRFTEYRGFAGQFHQRVVYACVMRDELMTQTDARSMGSEQIRRFGFVRSVTAMGIASATWEFWCRRTLIGHASGGF